MKNINLVIQRTFNGLEVFYNDEFVKTLENKEGISDERKDAAQIAHRSDVYSIYNDEKFSVFSFINTSAVDVAKREGIGALKSSTFLSESTIILYPSSILFAAFSNILSSPFSSPFSSDGSKVIGITFVLKFSSFK